MNRPTRPKAAKKFFPNMLKPSFAFILTSVAWVMGYRDDLA
jgi:hypothetical protein